MWGPWTNGQSFSTGPGSTSRRQEVRRTQSRRVTRISGMGAGSGAAQGISSATTTLTGATNVGPPSAPTTGCARTAHRHTLRGVSRAPVPFILPNRRRDRAGTYASVAHLGTPRLGHAAARTSGRCPGHPHLVPGGHASRARHRGGAKANQPSVTATHPPVGGQTAGITIHTGCSYYTRRVAPDKPRDLPASPVPAVRDGNRVRHPV